MKHIDQGILVVGFKCDVKADRGAGERLRRHFIKQTLDVSEHRLEMRKRPQRGRSGGVRPKASDPVTRNGPFLQEPIKARS